MVHKNTIDASDHFIYMVRFTARARRFRACHRAPKLPVKVNRRSKTNKHTCMCIKDKIDIPHQLLVTFEYKLQNVWNYNT